ncbi:hypothetical protein ACHAO4_004892 [Trichoderma viride]
MPATPLTNPLVDVQDPEDWDEDHRASVMEYKKLRGGANENVEEFVNLSDKDYETCCEHEVQGAFRMAGTSHENHELCYDACVKECVATRVLDVETWPGWRGYKDLGEQMNEILTLSESSGYLHSLSAPIVVAAIAVKRLRRIETLGSDTVTIQMLHLKTFEFAQLAIENYDPTFKFIGTDLPYRNELTLNQVSERTRKKRSQETKQRQNGENGNGLEETETDILYVDNAECYMINDKAGIMLEMQQFEATDSKPKEQTRSGVQGRRSRADPLLDEMRLIANTEGVTGGVKMALERNVYVIRHYVRTMESRLRQSEFVEGNSEAEEMVQKMRSEIRNLAPANRDLEEES